MGVYKIKISTRNFIPFTNTKKSLINEEVNRYMEKLDGWALEETELDHVRWRISYFFYYKKYFSKPGWIAWFHDRRNFISYEINGSTFYRASLYRESDGEEKAGKFIEELIANGYIKISFSEAFGDDKRYSGCYMEIYKEEG